MDTRIREIYACLIQDTKYMEELSREVEKKINQIVKIEKTEMDNQRFEDYRDKFFLAASIGEEAGFIKGFKYAVALFAECFPGRSALYCRALTIFSICSLVSSEQRFSSWRISCSIAEEGCLYSSARI